MYKRQYLGRISNRLTLFGAFFLMIIAIVPTVVLGSFGLSTAFGPTSLLIMVLSLIHIYTSFDGRGNYAMGLKEQLIFPEINYDDVDKIRGMDIVFVTTAKTDEEAKELLKLMGMPFVQA